ncbi:hypothetical protein CROQUDRAFT_715934 [Cronartium quercuum f. sp. fusiforme G11]|uniref:Uncharacterized protein n=1 Tax=Cronartium quercuum f. sp. fusiforme G11 TaxID=708437 RepID=A0A9P6TCK4_9BASI|nr:hypothetical protein CROQUDRAFT_715934 [Cronartium quercuum f. sp. fusiforme G11]
MDPNPHPPVSFGTSKAIGLELIARLDAIERAPRAVQAVSRLKSDGSNFEVWNKQLALTIYNITNSVTYLDSPSASTCDLRLDQLVFAMIFWSIEESLQSILSLGSSAHEAFQALKKKILSQKRTWYPPIQTSELANSTEARLVSQLKESANYLKPILNHSSHNSKVVIHQSESHIRLPDLPAEVLDRIIQCVRKYSSLETIQNRKDKWSGLKKFPYGNQPERSNYIFFPSEPPVLNSFQSLSVVNQKIYSLCRPWLWRSIRFPNAMPHPISRWHRRILPEHGHLVKILKVELSGAWLETQPPTLDAGFQDNWIIYSDNSTIPELTFADHAIGHRGLSPGSLTRVLVQCPNVVHLEIHMLALKIKEATVEARTALKESLIKLFIRLPKLQHLYLKAKKEDTWPGNWLNEIVSALPELRSFCGSGISNHHDTAQVESQNWLGSLSRLKHLHQLELAYTEKISTTWRLFTWSKQITDLTLDSCAQLSIADTLDLINYLSPNLTSLKLANLRYSTDQMNNSTNSRIFFDLPSLTKLNLSLSKDQISYDLLTNFQNCTQLKSIEYKATMFNHWSIIIELFHNQTWNQLQSLKLFSIGHSDNWDFVNEQFNFRKFCERQGLEFEFEYC